MAHVIKNYVSLAQTPLRRDALAILEAGLHAINTTKTIKQTLRRKGALLFVGKKKYALNAYQSIYLIGCGKASLDAACALEQILGSYLTDGLIIDIRGGLLKRIACRVGTHPYPSMQNVKATGEMVAMLKHVGKDDLVIALISGGGSSLLCRPTDLSCEEMMHLTDTLMRKGAPIEELNIVRKHTSDIQGGQLASLIFPARLVGLIFSDVPGNDPSLVASGPTYMDQSTTKDALRILKKYDVLKACALKSCTLHETPKNPALFTKVANHLIVSNQVAIHAMKEKAKKLGYKTRILSSALSGEARDVGMRLAMRVRKGEALIAGGETTVTVRGNGVGGRNQELTLGALSAIPDTALVISCASDGCDNSPAAGAIADSVSKAAAQKKRCSPSRFLERNDSFSFFKKIRQQIITGDTGANVSDLMLALSRK